jgi:bud site selection protein 20
MGGRCGVKGKTKGHNAKNKSYKRKIWLSRRDKDIDEIDTDIQKAEATTGVAEVAFEYDVDLPGGGQFYCSETAKHFIDAKALEDHKKTKFYKRRVKELKAGNLHNHQTSEWAAGMTTEKLPSAHATTTTA